MASAGTRAGRDGSVTEEERRKEITTTSDFFEATPALRAPAHLVARIFSQLDCVDLLNCSLVCNVSEKSRYYFGSSFCARFQFLAIKPRACGENCVFKQMPQSPIHALRSMAVVHRHQRSEGRLGERILGDFQYVSLSSKKVTVLLPSPCSVILLLSSIK
ncbi:hypothetical protein M5K25_013028 [Dendrobium thyrsiflorum]|uniref:F-box domain-containing protein n=1 Tax=Dendrobium thyrsiflorum TaxID=117978 RepID=A0ABD0UZ65_DENTH